MNNLRVKTREVTRGIGVPVVSAFSVEFAKLAGCADAAGTSQLPWHLLAGPSSVTFAGEELQLSFGSIFTETQYSAPEHLVPVALATIRFAEALRRPLSAYNEYSKYIDQRIILRTIQLIGSRPFLDPLSTTQPSYLIQSGRPHKLRTDFGFKYLVFLRRYLESLPIAERDALQDLSAFQVSEAMLEESAHIVQSCLLQFGAEMDTFTFPTGSPLEFLKVDRTSLEHGLYTPTHTFSLKFRHVHATYNSADGNHSELLVSPIILNARSRKTDWHEPNIAGPPKSATTLSLGDKAGHGLNHTSLVISIGDVVVNFSPSLIVFAQRVIHIIKLEGLFAKGSPAPPPDQPTNDVAMRPPARYIEVLLSTSLFKVKAGAQNLVIEYKAASVDFACSALLKPLVNQRDAVDISMNHSFSFREARLQGCALADMSKPDESAVLAALIFTGGKLNLLARIQPDTGPFIRMALGLRSLHLNVPRSAIRLYRFAQEWREDYLPGIEQTIRALLAELRSESRPSTPTPVSPNPSPSFSWLPRNVEILLGSFRVSLQVMRGTWVAWEVGNIISFTSSTPSLRGPRRRKFGLQIGAQTFIVSSKDRSSDSVPNVRVKLPLPTFTSTALFDGSRLDGLMLIEAFAVNVKPSHWDTLLTVQQKFGQDFSDLVALIEDSRPRSPRRKRQEQSTVSLNYRIQAKMKGFSIALEGVSSALLLECNRIGGTVSQSTGDLSGYIELSDLALSLAPRSNPASPVQSFDRGRRSAFVIIDAKAEMGDSEDHDGRFINVVVSKIHAVMQPSSIGQLGDYVDHLQVRPLFYHVEYVY